MEEIVDEEYTHFDSILKARLDSLPPKSRLFTYFYGEGSLRGGL